MPSRPACLPAKTAKTARQVCGTQGSFERFLCIDKRHQDLAKRLLPLLPTHSGVEKKHLLSELGLSLNIVKTLAKTIKPCLSAELR
jgi:hypothetical protein